MTIQNVTGIAGSNITISNLITGIEKRFVRSLLASTKKVALNLELSRPLFIVFLDTVNRCIRLFSILIV